MELYRVFFDLRVSEIFDIVVDYPDSEPALNDLRECMCEIDDSATFLKALQSSISRRLLHQGATTGVILSQYLAIIKCMKIIDPSNKFINKISVPIQLYLR